MYERDWRHYPVIGVIAFVALSGALDYGNDFWCRQAASNAQQQSQKPYAHSAPVIGSSHIPSAPRDVNADGHEGEDVGEHSNKPNWTDVADLFAQWTMALATIAIVAFTWLGLRVLRKTLTETEDAAKSARRTLVEAGRTTMAAFEANDLTAEIAKTQSSGMLTGYKARVKLDREEKGVRFQVKIVNIGDSPVYGVRYGAHCLITDDVTEITKPNEFVPTGFSLRPLAPGAEKWATVIHLGMDQLEAAERTREDNKFIKIWGAVSWSSIFKERNAYLFSFHTRASLTDESWSKLYLNPWGNTLAPEEDLGRY